jgi:hypothetical protein
LALALTIASALLAGSAGVAWGDIPAEQVTALIFTPGQQTPTPDSITIGALESSCHSTYTGPNIEFRNPDGSVSDPGDQIGTAWSLSDVLGCLPKPIAVKAVQGITILSSGGTPDLSPSAQITPADLAVPNDFANSAEAPIINDDGTVLQYYRPWRGQGDFNASDRVTATPPSPFQFEVSLGPTIPLSATASQATVTAGTTVTFTVAPSGSGSYSGLAYTWYLSGQQFATGASVQMPFNSAGTYNVDVQATDDAGGSGSARVQITVTSANQTPAPTSSNPNPTGSPTSNGGSGGTGNGTKPATGSATGHGNQGKGTSHGKSPAHGKTSTTTTAKKPGASTSPSTTRSPSPVKASPSTGRARVHSKPRRTAPGSGAAVVSGRLIGNVTPVAASASPLVHVVVAAPLGTAAAQRRPIPASIIPALAAGLAVLALFSLGAGRELRWWRHGALRLGS